MGWPYFSIGMDPISGDCLDQRSQTTKETACLVATGEKALVATGNTVSGCNPGHVATGAESPVATGKISLVAKMDVRGCNKTHVWEHDRSPLQDPTVHPGHFMVDVIEKLANTEDTVTWHHV